MQLRDDDFLDKKLEEYRKNYNEVLLSIEEYYQQFDNKMHGVALENSFSK
jgi:hypothetical protein